MNALYQRIGRAGRVRPGMAFIARDYGASYCDLDDATLAAGLPEAPIRYPLAKGSFLKLALYTFRESIPESELRDAIRDLNLPSHIEDDPHLWSRFLAERTRLRQIGIARSDGLTPAGKQALTFIGLDDMDFAKLLASVIERYSVNSDLATIFTVLAASSDLSFNDLMVPRFFLTNPKQLSAMEIFHEEALGVPVVKVYQLVAAHENDSDQEQLYDKLRACGVDDHLCSEICSLVREGYQLASSFEPARSDADITQKHTRSNVAPEQAGHDDASGDLLADSFDEGEEDVVAESEAGELATALLQDLDRFSTNHTLAFERAVVSFSEQTELINIYRVYRHFFNNYFSYLKTGTLSPLESSELRRSMEEEAGKLQISPRALNDLNNRFNQLRRHVGIQLLQDEGGRAGHSLSEDERLLLCQSCIREMLFEREGHDGRFDLCLRFFYLAEDRRNIHPRDYPAIVADLENFGFNTTEAEIKELWFLIIREVRRRCEDQIKLLRLDPIRETLPPVSKGIERELLRIVRESSCHTKLRFLKGDFNFTTEIVDQAGNSICVTLPLENTPLATALSGREELTVLAKVSPAMLSKISRDERSSSGFIKQNEKGFRLSHITLLG